MKRLIVLALVLVNACSVWHFIDLKEVENRKVDKTEIISEVETSTYHHQMNGIGMTFSSAALIVLGVGYCITKKRKQ